MIDNGTNNYYTSNHYIPSVPQQAPEVDEDTSNPFVNMVKTIFSFIISVIVFPFKLIWKTLKVANEVRIVVLGLITIIVVAIIVTILVFAFKPPFLWEPLKGFLNSDLKTPVYSNIIEQDIYQKINSGSVNEIKLSESEITYLFRKANLINENSVIGLTDNTMTIYFDADTKESPLWVYIEAKTDQKGSLNIQKTSFGRFGMPDFVSGWIASGFNSAMDLLGRQNRSSNLVLVMNQILDSRKISGVIQLKSAEIRNKQVVLKFDIIGLD